MKRCLLAVATAAALILPASAGARLAQGDQFEGYVPPNGCGAVQYVTVDGPTQVTALFAGTNAGGQLVSRIVDTNGNVLSHTGPYTTPAAGTYGVQVCFLSDGIDNAPVEYVGMVETAAR